MQFFKPVRGILGSDYHRIATRKHVNSLVEVDSVRNFAFNGLKARQALEIIPGRSGERKDGDLPARTRINSSPKCLN